MSNLTSFVTEAFKDHLNFLSVKVTIEGVEYSALPAEAEIAPDLDLGGVSDQAEGAVILEKKDFISMPRVGTRILVDGELFRIHAIQKSVGNPLVSIEYIGATER